MLRLLLIPFLCYALSSNACICDIRPLDESIKNYPFIAHVKILYEPKGIDTSLRLEDTWKPFSHSAIRTLQIIELFKGDSVKRIMEYDINSSCEIGLEPGEEWIIFASYDAEKKIYSVGACSPSQQLRSKEGEQGISYWSGNQGMMQLLRKHFNHTSSGPKYQSGQFKAYYPNGNIEWEASYRDGQLDGNRKIYFANAILWQNENYKQGKKEGTQQRYAKSGQLLEEMRYADDKISTAVYWHDTSYFERRMAILLESPPGKSDSVLRANPPIIQKRMEAFYSPAGNYYAKKYNRKSWLEEEIYRDDSTGLNITCRYEKSGKLSFEVIITKYNEHTTEKKWDSKGELVSYKEWEKGKFLGDKINR
jgi:antitoxin component YwqK of YwqJK toxin-antitoxin module